MRIIKTEDRAFEGCSGGFRSEEEPLWRSLESVREIVEDVAVREMRLSLLTRLGLMDILSVPPTWKSTAMR